MATRAVISPQYMNSTTLISAQTIPVASEQWPYDVDLLAATLNSSSKHINSAPVVIGIADNGLADRNGGPLFSTVFDEKQEQEPPPEKPEPDNIDEDSNDYIDDIVGAGVTREGELSQTGDIGLCHDQALFSSWNDDTL